MNEEQHIEIPQPENTNRYWCPIDIPQVLDTEENEIKYAKRYTGWDGLEDRKVSICNSLRHSMIKNYKTIAIEEAQELARQQVESVINEIL